MRLNQFSLAARDLSASNREDKRWLWREAWLEDSAGNKVCLYFTGQNRRFPPWRLDGKVGG
jgi:hydroxymethylpyrimidine/phosphomethylpyrimidine kinase